MQFQATETITQITLTGQTAGISINIKDKNRWLNNHFNSRRALDFSVVNCINLAYICHCSRYCGWIPEIRKSD
uniref:Uncharacterized protein n=1 Tax=Oryza nivara TaxID=4536 RepID=A0A0E0FUC9_ORYNI